jgi:hypothetical protein
MDSPNNISTSKHIDGPTFSADIDWDKDGQPVIYVVGRGKASSPREALAIIETAVQMVDAGPFEHVCSVYNMLEVTHLPLLARFIRAGNFPSSSKTAHIIIGTNSQSLQLVASLVAVLASKRLRTMEACKTNEEIEQAVKRWLMLPDRARSYTVNDV